MKNMRTLIYSCVIGYLSFIVVLILYSLITTGSIKNKTDLKHTSVWQVLYYKELSQSESRKGPVNSDFYWDEISSSKKFNLKIEKMLYGTQGSFVTPCFEATESGFIGNQNKHELVLVMYHFNGFDKPSDKTLLREFKVGLENYLAELAKRGTEVTPVGTPMIYREPHNLYKNLKAFFLISLLSLPGSVIIWLLFTCLYNKKTK